MLSKIIEDDKLETNEINFWKCIECGFEIDSNVLGENFQCSSVTIEKTISKKRL